MAGLAAVPSSPRIDSPCISVAEDIVAVVQSGSGAENERFFGRAEAATNSEFCHMTLVILLLHSKSY